MKKILNEEKNQLDQVTGAILSRSVKEDQQVVAEQWAKTFSYNGPNDPATGMIKIFMAAVAQGLFQTRAYLSDKLGNPTAHLTVADYFSHASRIIIDYQELSPNHQAELLGYFDLSLPGVFARSATHAVRRSQEGAIVEDKGLFLGVAGQAPTFLKTPYDFGVNIAMGGKGQRNFYGKTISDNGYSGHVYFHRNDSQKLLMCGLEQSAPAASILELLSYSYHEHEANVQHSVDQFGQGHSMVGASDRFTAAGSLYFSDPLYQAKLLLEHNILPPDKYGAMQVILNDQNWGAVKTFFEMINENNNIDVIKGKLLETPSTSERKKMVQSISYIQLDFSNYLKQCFNVYIAHASITQEKRDEIKIKQDQLLTCIQDLQSGRANKITQLLDLIKELSHESYPEGYKCVINRIQLLVDLEFQANQQNSQSIQAFEEAKHKIFLKSLYQDIQIRLKDIINRAKHAKEFYTSPYLQADLGISEFLDDLDRRIVSVETAIRPQGGMTDSLLGSWLPLRDDIEVEESTIRELSELHDSMLIFLDDSPKLAPVSTLLDFSTQRVQQLAIQHRAEIEHLNAQHQLEIQQRAINEGAQRDELEHLRGIVRQREQELAQLRQPNQNVQPQREENQRVTLKTMPIVMFREYVKKKVLDKILEVSNAENDPEIKASLQRLNIELNAVLNQDSLERGDIYIAEIKERLIGKFNDIINGDDDNYTSLTQQGWLMYLFKGFVGVIAGLTIVPLFFESYRNTFFNGGYAKQLASVRDDVDNFEQQFVTVLAG